MTNLATTYKHATAAGKDAGHKSAKAAARYEWSASDWAAACDAFNRVRDAARTVSTTTPKRVRKA